MNILGISNSIKVSKQLFGLQWLTCMFWMLPCLSSKTENVHQSFIAIRSWLRLGSFLLVKSTNKMWKHDICFYAPLSIHTVWYRRTFLAVFLIFPCKILSNCSSEHSDIMSNQIYWFSSGVILSFVLHTCVQNQRLDVNSSNVLTCHWVVLQYLKHLISNHNILIIYKLRKYTEFLYL